MSKQTVCGFLVVRKPELNIYEKGKGVFLSPVPCIDGKYYCGIDRMPWFEIEDADATNSLPEGLDKLWKDIGNRNENYPDFQLVADIGDAKKLLEYSNRAQPRNELVAIYSQKLAEAKGTFSSPVGLTWLGIDIDCLGYGSQISQGIFTAPDVFSEFCNLLNSNGLFEEDGPVVDQYIKAYLKREKEANLEPMSDVTVYLDRIHLWRVT